MSQVTSPTEPGWLPDPSGRYEWRYWDGGWTNRVANSAPAAPPASPTGAPAPPAPSAAARTAFSHEPAPAPVAAAPLAAATAVVDAPAPESPGALTARDTVARAPFGDEAAAPPAPAPTPKQKKARRAPWTVVVGFFRSFADEPESYHSELAREPLPSDPRGERIVATAPGNYGYAMIVACAAVGIVVGAYLPWISGTIGLAPFHRSGFDQGLGGGYSIGAIALAASALLTVRMRAFRWLTIILSFVMAGFVIRDLLHSYDAMQTMNRSGAVDANVGWGLWIMIVAAAIGMIGAVRLSEDEKIN